MVDIAVLGHGTVGEGICRVIDGDRGGIRQYAGDEIRVKYILEAPNYPQDKRTERMVFDIGEILKDGDVKIVAEAIGGEELPYNFAKKCLCAKKSVVTSNKELVARHGKELLDIAFENNVNFLFGASVGGGIPILRSLRNSFMPGEINGIEAVLNGTTNYILTKMGEQGQDFAEALSAAQSLGYAEANPTDDLEGFDTARKLAILLSLITGKRADYKNIPRKGITGVTAADIASANKLGCDIKLLAFAKIEDDGAFAFVGPALVKRDNPLSAAKDVFNAITLKSRETGEVMLYGRGAGKMPTASAAVMDILDCVKYRDANIVRPLSDEELTIKDLGGLSLSQLLVVDVDFNVDKGGVGAVDFELINDMSPVIITPAIRLCETDKKVRQMEEHGVEVIKRLPIV